MSNKLSIEPLEFQLVREGCMRISLPYRQSTPLKFVAFIGVFILVAGLNYNVLQRVVVGQLSLTDILSPLFISAIFCYPLIRVWANKTYTEIQVTASRVAHLETLFGPVKIPFFFRTDDLDHVMLKKVNAPTLAPSSLAQLFGMTEETDWFGIAFGDELPLIAMGYSAEILEPIAKQIAEFYDLPYLAEEQRHPA